MAAPGGLDLGDYDIDDDDDQMYSVGGEVPPPLHKRQRSQSICGPLELNNFFSPNSEHHTGDAAMTARVSMPESKQKLEHQHQQAAMYLNPDQGSYPPHSGVGYSGATFGSDSVGFSPPPLQRQRSNSLSNILSNIDVAEEEKKYAKGNRVQVVCRFRPENKQER